VPRRASLAAIGAAASAALLILVWYATFHVGLFERADRSVLSGFADLKRTGSLANFIAHLCNPKPYVYLAAVPVLVALGRRRPRVALAIGAVLFGANATTQLLKPLLAHPRAGLVLSGLPVRIGAASWPSGHATAAMSLALCSVLAAPARWRPLVATLGAAFAVAVSYSFLSLAWHFPSDVLGGFLVAGAWTLLAVAVVSTADARWPRRADGEHARALSVREALGPPLVAVLSAVALLGLVALARPHAVVAYTHLHKAFVFGAAAIGVLGLALATALSLVLRPGISPVPTAAPRPRSRLD
jgi:membrane-associated phospholipid phosphatase